MKKFLIIICLCLLVGCSGNVKNDDIVNDKVIDNEDGTYTKVTTKLPLGILATNTLIILPSKRLVLSV